MCCINCYACFIRSKNWGGDRRQVILSYAPYVPDDLYSRPLPLFSWMQTDHYLSMKIEVPCTLPSRIRVISNLAVISTLIVLLTHGFLEMASGSGGNRRKNPPSKGFLQTSFWLHFVQRRRLVLAAWLCKCQTTLKLIQSIILSSQYLSIINNSLPDFPIYCYLHHLVFCPAQLEGCKERWDGKKKLLLLAPCACSQTPSRSLPLFPSYFHSCLPL